MHRRRTFEGRHLVFLEQFINFVSPLTFQRFLASQVKISVIIFMSRDLVNSHKLQFYLCDNIVQN